MLFLDSKTKLGAVGNFSKTAIICVTSSASVIVERGDSIVVSNLVC